MWQKRKLLLFSWKKQRVEYKKKIKKKKGESAAIFKLKEKELGSRKEGSESVSMNDPETGEMICDPEELKRAFSQVSVQPSEK